MKKGFAFICVLFGLYGVVLSQAITVTTPGSGENWERGSSYTIRWTINGTMDGRVKIRLYDSAGRNLIRRVVDDTNNDGSYGPWKVPEDITPGQYVIRVRTLIDKVADDSAVFNITESKKVELTLANGPGGKQLRKTPVFNKPDYRDNIMPRITEINPAASTPGSPVGLRGRNFGQNKGGKEIFIQGVSNSNQYRMEVVWWSNNNIQAKVKDGAQSGNYMLSIRSQAGKLLSNEVAFKVNSKRIVTSITPGMGPKGTRFTLKGPDFGVRPSENLRFMMINDDRFGIPFTLVSWGKNRIEGEVTSDIAGQGLWEIVVEHPIHVDYTTRVKFRVIPVITHTIPDEGPFKNGSKILIYGKSFLKDQGNQKVVISGNGRSQVLSVTLWSDEIIAARFNETFPPGTYWIRIVNNGLSFHPGIPIVITP